MKTFLKNDMIKKVVSSYIALLLIPVILFASFVIFFCSNYIVKALLNQQNILADRYADELNVMMGQFINSIDGIKKNKIFYLEYSKDIPVVFLDIRDYLKKEESSSKCGASIYYYDLYHGTIHTSTGVYQRVSFLQDIMGEYTHLKSSVWILQDKTINYVVPLEHGKNNILKSTVVFSIDSSYFERVLNYTSEYDDMISIVTYDNKILYQSDHATINGLNPSQYYHIVSKSQTSGRFGIEHYIPKKAFYKHFHKTMFLSLVITIFMLVVGGIIIFIMIKKNYTPLKKSIERLLPLVYYTEKYEYNPSCVDSTITKILEQNQVLSANLQTLTKEHFLLQLIYTPTKNENAIAQSKLAGVNLFGPCYVCIIAHLPQNEELQLPLGLSYEKISINEKMTCVILSAGQHILEDAIGILSQHYKKEDTGEYIIGIGSIVTNISLLNESFLYAKIARHDATRAQLPISSFSESISKTSTAQYPYDLIEALENACSCANVESITYMTQLIKDCILKVPNRFLCICIYHDYLKTISDTIETLCIDNFDSIKLRNNHYSKVPGSREDILDTISGICLYVVKCINENNNKEKQSLSIDAIKNYVSTNYQDRNFSLKNLADHFKTSQSNLSHFFRKEMKTTLSEYVDLLRIEYAKELLQYSNSNVNSISQALGFANPSTFIRKFKKIEGIPPGEYKQRTTS